MLSSVHSVNSTVTFPESHVMSVLAPCGILKDRIAFYHGAFGFCTISTLCSAIDKLSLASLPGQLTSEAGAKASPFF